MDDFDVLSPIQQLRDQRIDALGDASGGGGLAHAAAGGLEVEIVGNYDFGCDFFRFGASSGEFGVQRDLRIEAQDRQREHHLVEIACAPLITDLASGDSFSCRLAVQYSGQVSTPHPRNLSTSNNWYVQFLLGHR